MRKKTKNQRNRIYIQDWLAFKPYNQEGESDYYFLTLCNEYYDVLKNSKLYDYLLEKYDRQELKSIAIIIFSYFEDLISDTNIWNSFITKHKELYGVNIPFFDLKDYTEEENNIQDIQFLIWYTLNTYQQDSFIYPENSFIKDLSLLANIIIDREWEVAPENAKLKSKYTIDPKEKSYFKVREVMRNVLFDSYLFFPDTGSRLGMLLSEIEPEETIEITEKILQAQIDEYLHTFRTKLLNLKAKEWLSLILEKTHKGSKHLTTLSPKITGYFFYRKSDDTHYHLEHVATGKAFKVTKDSVSLVNLKDENSLCYISIIRWNDTWWSSGSSFQLDFDANLVLDERNSVESRNQVSFLDKEEQVDLTDDILSGHRKSFLEHSNNLPFVFISSRKVDDFCRSIMELHNKNLNLSAEEKQASVDRARQSGLFVDDYSNNHQFEEDSCLIYFNKKSGIEILPGFNKVFPLDYNPYYSEVDNLNSYIYTILMTDNGSAELVKEWLSQCKDKLDFFETKSGQFIYENLDFLLRFWKTENYQQDLRIATV